MSTIPAAPPRARPGWKALLVTAGLVALLWISLDKTEFSLGELVDGYHGMVSFIGDATPPDLTWSTVVRPGLLAGLVTFYIGLAGTALSLPFALLLAVLGSRTMTSNPATYQAARSVMSALRAIPVVIFALVFVTAVGLGPFPGVLAIVFHGSGVLAKTWSEAMDEADQGPIEALRTTGASKVQLLQHALLPTVAPSLVGLALYRLDVNVREALTLGLIGAGGIGFSIHQWEQEFRFDRMLTQILIVLLIVVIVDQVSAYIRKRLAP